MLTTAKALTVDPAKRDMIVGTIANLRKFRFCGPSDDPDEQTAVTVGYRYLVTQLQRWVAPLVGDDIAERLNALDVEVNNIYSAYDVRAELDALLPDIETAIEALADRERSAGMSIRANPIPTAVCAVVGECTWICHLSSSHTGEAVLRGWRGRRSATWQLRQEMPVLAQAYARRCRGPDGGSRQGPEEYMEVDHLGDDRQGAGRKRITDTLARFGLSYRQGGLILGVVNALPTKSLRQVLKGSRSRRRR